MDKIELRRGGRKVVYKKLPDRFAVRLKQGKASSKRALESSLGPPSTKVKHLNSVDPERMEIFAVDNTAEMEETVDELRKKPSADVISHIYTVDETAGEALIPTGTITIQFLPDVKKADREKILADFGLEILDDLDFLLHGYTVRLTAASKENPLKIAAKLQHYKEIKMVEPDLSFEVSLQYVPTDTYYRWQWHLNNRGDRLGLVAGADVKAEGAWDHTLGNRNITICIIDDGFDLEHPDFSAPGKIVASRDFGQNDFDPNPIFVDDNHGTCCAGVALAEENGVGVVGLAPRCSFMPVRMSEWLSDNTVVEYFQYAIDNNADIISCSWHARAWNAPISEKIKAIIHKTATQGRSNRKGCVILFAAGNQNRPLNGYKDGKTSYQGFALHPDVIAVAASNSMDQFAPYSNYGPEITICAPSSGSPGRGIVTTDRRGLRGYTSDDYRLDFGGTSSSTPLAAGLAGLIFSTNPDLTSAEVKRIMMETADKIDMENGQYVNGHSPHYGAGRINAERAVAVVAGRHENRTSEVLFMEHRINKPIPDLSEVEDRISFPLNVKIKDIEIEVDIQHHRPSDLVLILRPPQVDEITLQDRVGNDQGHIIRKFSFYEETELFESIMGTSAKGNWRFRVVDMAGSQTGVIRKWGLAVSY